MKRDKFEKTYVGDVAAQYDDIRENTGLWRDQQTTVEKYLDMFPAGTHVLDVPVGTGRFLKTYERKGFIATGIDASADMLEKARTRSTHFDLRIGNAFQLDIPDGTFDLVVCIRFFNWLNPSDFERAFAEMSRVTRGAMIANVKTFTPLREMKPGQAARQWKSRIGWMFRPADIVCHEWRHFTEVLHRHGMVIQQSTRTTPPYESKRGIENDVYLMQKK